MRDRETSTTVASSDRTSLDLVTGVPGTLANANGSYHDTVSKMIDQTTGHRFQTKPVTHMSYRLDLQNCPFSVYNSSDMSNAPNPRVRYDGYMPYTGHQHEPPLLGQAPSYIPVTGRTLDDYADCVFRAYNIFTNEYRGLDGSQSVAEARETPQLFNIWNRRKGLATNLTGGFLNYSFGWRPVYSDMVAITRELRSFPARVRKRLRNKQVLVRHYRFDLSDTVDDLTQVHASAPAIPYNWNGYEYKTVTKRKVRKVVVTIRATVKPKMTGEGQKLLEKLGRYGLIPSLATLWSVTRLSFVVDWFYNIGGAIENLQGSLISDVSGVSVCVTDKRERVLALMSQELGGNGLATVVRFTEEQKYFSRFPATVPRLPQLTVPRRPMQYVLLGFIALVTTNGGRKLLRTADRYEESAKRTLDRWDAAFRRRYPKFNSFIDFLARK